MTNEIIVLSPASIVSMADEWYDFATADHFWMEWRLKVLLRYMEYYGDKIEQVQRLLEIGCGHGQFIKQLENNTAGEIDGCDLNLLALEKSPSIKGKLYLYDIEQNLDSMVDKYSGIFLLDVIEHIDDDSKFVLDSLNHLKAGGLIFINVPALQSLYSRYDIVAGHKRRYTKKDIERLFRNLGVEVLHVGYWGLFLVPVVLIRKLYLRIIPMSKIIEKGFKPPSQFVNNFFKVVMRLELFLFNNPMIGTSVFAVGRKMKTPTSR